MSFLQRNPKNQVIHPTDQNIKKLGSATRRRRRHNLALTQHSDRELAGCLQVLDDALRHHPHVILAGDFLIGRGAQDAGGFLPGRVQQHHPGLALDELLQVVPRVGDQDGAQYGELERVLHVGDSLSNRLYEVVVTSYLRGDYAELMPLVPLQDAQHRRGLMLQRRRQLQLQAALRRPLQTNGIPGYVSRIPPRRLFPAVGAALGYDFAVEACALLNKPRE